MLNVSLLNLHCLKFEPKILEENFASNASNVLNEDSILSKHLSFPKINHIIDENKIGNDLSSAAHHLKKILSRDDKHEDTFFILFNQAMYPNVDEDL